MEFKKKLSNVAFGGDWSEQLLTRHEIDQWLKELQWAVDNCRERDVNTVEVRRALAKLTKNIEKGQMLADRFNQGHSIVNQSLRHSHFKECFRLIKVWDATK